MKRKQPGIRVLFPRTAGLAPRGAGFVNNPGRRVLSSRPFGPDRPPPFEARIRAPRAGCAGVEAILARLGTRFRDPDALRRFTTRFSTSPRSRAARWCDSGPRPSSEPSPRASRFSAAISPLEEPDHWVWPKRRSQRRFHSTPPAASSPLRPESPDRLGAPGRPRPARRRPHPISSAPGEEALASRTFRTAWLDAARSGDALSGSPGSPSPRHTPERSGAFRRSRAAGALESRALSLEPNDPAGPEQTRLLSRKDSPLAARHRSSEGSRRPPIAGPPPGDRRRPPDSRRGARRSRDALSRVLRLQPRRRPENDRGGRGARDPHSRLRTSPASPPSPSRRHGFPRLEKRHPDRIRRRLHPVRARRSLVQRLSRISRRRDRIRLREAPPGVSPDVRRDRVLHRPLSGRLSKRGSDRVGTRLWFIAASVFRSVSPVPRVSPSGKRTASEGRGYRSPPRVLRRLARAGVIHDAGSAGTRAWDRF